MNLVHPSSGWSRALLGTVLPFGVLAANVAYVAITGDRFDSRFLFFVAILAAAWFGGLRPGLLVTFACAFVSLYTWQSGLQLADSDASELSTFVLIGLTVSFFSFWRRQAEQRLNRSHDRLAALHENATSLLRPSDPPAIGRALVQECLQLTEASGGFVAWYRVGLGRPLPLGAAGLPIETIEKWTNAEETPLARAFFTQQAQFIRSRTQLARDYTAFSELLDPATEAMAVIPIAGRGRRHGAICLTFPRRRWFRRGDIEVVVTLVEQAAQALDRCETLAGVERQSHEFNIVSEASLAFTEPEIESSLILQKLVDVCARHLADSVAAYIVAGKSLERVAERDSATPVGRLPAGRARAQTVAFGKGLSGLVAVTGRGRVIHQTPPEFIRDNPEAFGEERIENPEHSAVSVPVSAAGQVLAVLTMERHGNPSLNQTDAQIAQELAKRAGLALMAASRKLEAEQELERRQKVEGELREREVMLEEALAAKDEFLGLVSHELRTPLTMIRGNADILRRRPDLQDPERSEAIGDVAANSERLARIVENMLLLARLEAGQRLALTPVLLDPVLVQAKEEFLRESPKADLRLKFSDKRLIVAGNEDYINQVLENLLSNAVKYGDSHRPVEVLVHRDGAFAIVEVADRGSGISPEGLEDLFKPFHREKSQNTNASGLGLGLAVCKRLVEAQGGNIEARPRKGGGAIFSFGLPMWPAEEDGQQDFIDD